MISDINFIICIYSQCVKFNQVVQERYPTILRKKLHTLQYLLQYYETRTMQ